MSSNLIGTEPGNGLGSLADIILKFRGGVISAEMLDLFAKGQLIPAPGVKLVASRDPLDVLVTKIERKLSRKLGRHIVPCPLPTSITVENLAKWAAFNMQLIFLPEFDLTENAWLPKGGCRLGDAYYQRLRKGKIGEVFPGIPPTKVQPGWYLADMSIGADFTDGTQMFFNDPWTPLFICLRAEKRIGGYPGMPAGSRFAITHDEWARVVLGFMASELGFPRVNLRLERASEFNAIGNIYDPNRGKFDMWVWLADPLMDPGHLVGGYRALSGSSSLTSVGCVEFGHRSRDIAARPLVVL